MEFLSILGIVVKVVLALGVVWLALVILEALASTANPRSAKRDQAAWDSPAGQATVKASHDAWLKAQASPDATGTSLQGKVKREADLEAWVMAARRDNDPRTGRHAGGRY
jgi:hypothetical protein